jgi:ferredoxin
LEEDISKEKVDNMIRQTDLAVDEISAKIGNRSTEFKEEEASGKNKASFIDKLLWKLKSSPILEFFVDNTCTGCGVCETVCLSKR